MTCLCPHCPPCAPVVPAWEEEARRFATGVGAQVHCCGFPGARMPLVCGQSEACGDRVIR